MLKFIILLAVFTQTCCFVNNYHLTKCLTYLYSSTNDSKLPQIPSNINSDENSDVNNLPYLPEYTIPTWVWKKAFKHNRPTKINEKESIKLLTNLERIRKKYN